MQAWIYSPLQRIASDSSMDEGREGGNGAHWGGWKMEWNQNSKHSYKIIKQGGFKMQI